MHADVKYTNLHQCRSFSRRSQVVQPSGILGPTSQKDSRGASSDLASTNQSSTRWWEVYAEIEALEIKLTSDCSPNVTAVRESVMVSSHLRVSHHVVVIDRPTESDLTWSDRVGRCDTSCMVAQLWVIPDRSRDHSKRSTCRKLA